MSAITTRLTANSTVASAEAKPQSSAAVTLPMILEIITSRGPPSIAGVMKKASARTKTSRKLAPTPGMLSGRNTRRNAVNGFAPRSVAASISVQSIRSSEANTGRMNSGR